VLPSNPDQPHQRPPTSASAQAVNFLVVDSEESTGRALSAALTGAPAVVHLATTLAEARTIAQSAPIDVAIVGVKLSDGDGLALTGELRQKFPAVRSIVVTGRRSYRGALDAMRAGASDYLAKPLSPAEVGQCLDRALRRSERAAPGGDRIERLRKLCKELNHARHAMGRRVGALCNDLTVAYHQLAGQVHHAQLIGRFKAAVEQELDLEKVLRRFLEIVLHEVGATNAVVFLPSTTGSFAVGGYINYNLDKGGLEVMLEHLTSLAAPALAACEEPRCIAGPAEIRQWLGGKSRWLESRAVLALPCRHGEELMAGLLLFRNGAEPYDAATAAALNAIGPILASHLRKVVQVHHRLRANDEALDHGDGSDPDEMQF
jgi:DNA-binding response OmpR family regulator